MGKEEVMKSNRIIENYRDNEIMRNEFHSFISHVFPSISFKEWFARRCWTENYIPFSIMDSGKIISSASATLMNIVHQGVNLKAIQIGAVGTLPEYRSRGLARELMNHIIDKYKDEVDFFFLHANETVLEFYPKFAFRSVQENIFVSELNNPESNYSARKLNIEDDDDYLLLQDLLNNRCSLTNVFGAEDYGFITMWHILNLYRDNLFYLEKENVIVIKNEKKDTVHILDVIFNNSFDFKSILPKLIESDTIKNLKYYFPPDQLNFNYDRIIEEDTGLFILGDLELGNNQFRFPETAVT